MDNKQPASVIRDGSIKATLWENKSEKGTFISAQFAKTYEDKEGKLKDSTSFSGTDLLRISELARKAYAVSNRIRKENASENGASSEQPAQESKPKTKTVEYSL